MSSSKNTLARTVLCMSLLLTAKIGLADQHVVRLSNDYLSLQITTREDRVQTTRIENRRAGTTLELVGDDFVLEFEDGSSIASSSLTLDKVIKDPNGIEGQGGKGQGVAFELSGQGVQVRYVTELRPEQWWASRWLEIRGTRRRLSRVHLARWKCSGATGPADVGKIVDQSLGYPRGCGQVVYAKDLFFAIAHPGAENFVTGDGATGDGITCSIPAYREISDEETIRTPKLVVGAGAAGDAWRGFVRYIDATRPVPSRMLFMVNDWYWQDKSKPLRALDALVAVKRKSGVPVDTFTLDDGWDFDWDDQTKIWGRLNRKRFPGGWDALQAAARAGEMNVSLWVGPIGGYQYRPRRIAFAREIGFEIYGDKLCLNGPRYKKHVIDSFKHWAAQGMDYIKVDGFWPDCPKAEHGHPVGPSGGIAQMDGLIDVFAAWRTARPDLLIGYTSGSHPSPFWLQHADYVWRGGRDDNHSGKGTPFDQHNTYLDSILQNHRGTDMPISAFVTFDIVQDRIRGGDERSLERGFWWLAARTSLHHDWYIQATDLSLAQWKTLAKAARWAKRHEKTFRFSRMIGGDPSKGETYGFSAFDGKRGILAIRNPSDQPSVLEGTLAQWLLLPDAARDRTYDLHGVHGHIHTLEGSHAAMEPLRIEIPALEIAVFEVYP